MFEFGLTTSKVIWLLAAIFIIYSVFWLIRTFSDDFYSARQKSILLFLRLIIVLVFVALFLDLKVEHQVFKKSRSEIAFLWDTSESMALQDGFSIEDVLKTGFYKDVSRQATISHVQNMLAPKYISPLKLRRQELNEKMSDNSALLRFAEKDARYTDLFLVTDGQSYLGEELESYKTLKDLKIHVVAVGNESKEALPIIQSIRYPNYISQGDSILVKYDIYNPGKTKLDLEIMLYVDGVARQNKINLDAYRSKNIQTYIVFNTEGLHELEWKVRSDKKEIGLTSRQLLVHPSKLTIVFSANPPDRDVSMVKYVLDDQERYECYHYDEWEKQFPEKEPDVLVQTWHPQQEVKRFKDTPALLFYRDRQGEYISSSVMEILDYKPYFHVTPDPRENARYWKQLPPVQVAKKAWRGTVLLKDSKDYAFILEQENDIVIAASGLWSWNLASYQKDWEGLYRSLMQGIVENLVGKHADKMIKLMQETYSVKAYWPLGISVDLSEKIEEDYQLKLSLLDSTYDEIKRIESDKADDIFYFKINRQGSYYLKADLFISGELINSDTSNVTVEKNNMEISQLALNEPVLKKLVENNKGGYFSYNSLDTIRYELETKEKNLLIDNYFEARSAYFLYIILFLLLITDWIIRKKNGGI